MSTPNELKSSPGEGVKRGRLWHRAGTRPWRILLPTVGLAAVVGLVLPVVWGDARWDPAAPQGLAAPTKTIPVPRVEVVRPVRGGVRRLTMQPGSVHAFESVDLYAKASGFLKTQRVDIGSPIKRGETLAEIDDPELQRDVEEATAKVEQAGAQAEQAGSRVATAMADRDAADCLVVQAQSDIARLASNRVLAEKQYERIKDLSARDAIDRKLVDEQQQALESAQAAERTGHAAVKTARAQAAASVAKIVQAKADVAEARAFVRVAEARLARARVLDGYTRITAPFDGVVTRRTFHPGAFIRSAADGAPEPLLTVMRTDKMRVVIQVPDLDVPLLDVGDKVTITVDALKGREIAGAVSRLGKQEDPTTRTMRVEVDLPNPDGLLVEGMYGGAIIELQPPTDHLTVPAACVVGHTERGKAVVFLARDGKARRTIVTVANDDGSSVEILSGLEPNDEVILRPGTTLDDGAPILVTGVPAKDAARR